MKKKIKTLKVFKNKYNKMENISSTSFYNKFMDDIKSDKFKIVDYIEKILSVLIFIFLDRYYQDVKIDLTIFDINYVISLDVNQYKSFNFEKYFESYMENIEKKEYDVIVKDMRILYNIYYYLIYIAIDILYLNIKDVQYSIDKVISSNVIFKDFIETEEFSLDNIFIEYSDKLLFELIDAFKKNDSYDKKKIKEVYKEYEKYDLTMYKEFKNLIEYYKSYIKNVYKFIKNELKIIHKIENESDNVLLEKIKEYTNIYLNKTKNHLSPLESKYFKFLNYKNEDGYIFNPSTIYIGGGEYLTIFRNDVLGLEDDIEKIKLVPKGYYNCNNYLKSELTKRGEFFMWGNWSIPSKFYFEDLYVLSRHDSNFVVDLSKKIDIYDIISNDRRLIKIKVDEYYDFLKDFMKDFSKIIDDMIIDDYFILTYDSSLSSIDILTADDLVVVLNGLRLKGKNFSFIGAHDGKLIFTDWFYKDGLKLIKIDKSKKTEEVNVLSPIQIFGSGSMTTENNMPEFSFTTPNLKIDKNKYIGVGHIKIKNQEDNYNKNIKYSRTLSDLFRYVNCENQCDYIRHAFNKLSCKGYQYYIYFYVFEINDDFTKMNYFKISDSFIPIVNDAKQFYEKYEYSLIFPNGIDYNQDEDVVVISLGEGDVRNFILKYDLETILKACIHDITNIDMEKYNIYPMIY